MLPDQMSLLNPLLIILLIPLFEFCVYPALATKGLLTKPLQRMGAGGFLAASSFFVAGFIQLKIDGDAIRPPLEGQIRVTSVMPFGSACSLFIGETEFKDQLVSKDVEFSLLNQTTIGHCDFKRKLSFSNNSNDTNVSHKNGLIISTWPDAQYWTKLSYTVQKSEGGNSTAFVLLHPSFSKSTQNSTLEVWRGRNFVDSYNIDPKNEAAIVHCRNVTIKDVVSRTGAVDLFVIMENSSYSE
uniref:Uncharacterized protein n=1 Tax=Romanomermis culicivorax TaxID=13658 RepID=A0A915L9B1_ROMCU